MLKASSGSGLTNEEKAVTPTHSGYYLQYPIDCIHHIFHDTWKPIPTHPIHQWHLFLLSKKFKKDLHVRWAYKLGWHIHFLKIPYPSLICSILPFTWLPDMTVSIYPPILTLMFSFSHIHYKLLKLLHSNLFLFNHLLHHHHHIISSPSLLPHTNKPYALTLFIPQLLYPFHLLLHLPLRSFPLL